MKFFEIEKALKICAAGAKEKMTKCPKCPYLEKGCLSAMLSDTVRYIDYLKSPRRRRYEENKKTAEIHTPPKRAKPSPPYKRGKPVAEWLEEQNEERKRTGAPDIGDIPW